MDSDLPPSPLIRIGDGKDQATLSKSQKEFNRLIRKIETLEKELEDYRTISAQIMHRMRTEILPLQTEFHRQRANLVRAFDRAYDSGFFKANERKKLADLILNLTFNLISEHGFDELKVIYDKYDPAGFDPVNDDALTPDLLKQRYRNLFRADDDSDTHSSQKNRRDQAEPNGQQTDEPWSEPFKTRKQLEKEARKQTEEHNTTKAVRTVYMALVKAFHPDRERDEAEKERKTSIMHRITEAYRQNNLLALLRLQLEADQLDQQHLKALAEGQLKYYNKILKQQTQELEEQLQHLQAQLSVLSNQPPHFWTSPARLENSLKSDAQGLKRELKVLKNNLAAFQNYDVLKHFLKTYRLQKEGDFNGF
ncbi:hypothetical protein GCM10027347_02280 [Larkinella harenae]